MSRLARLFAWPRTGWRRAALAAGGVVLLAGTAWCFRGPPLPWAAPAPPPASVPAAPAPDATTTDYAHRVVAYVHGTEAVTRQDLGEYLIARHGADKLPHLLNRRVIDHACRAQGIEVTAAEVEASFAEELRGLKMDVDTFVKTLLPRYKKSLFEWKEDVIRPRLLLTRLVRGTVTVSDDEARKLFEARHGEKVEGRLILWPVEQKQAAMGQYAKLRGDEEAFAQAAKAQTLDSGLAAAGGKIKQFGRHTVGEARLEEEAFKLRPGEVTTLIETPKNIALFKCDGRHPADTTVSFDAVAAKLREEVKEQKVQQQMQAAFEALRDKARPQPLLKKGEKVAPGAPAQVVGYHHDKLPVTREELGEYLIARHGADKLELLVNRRIIDKACQEAGIAVTDAEVEKSLDEDLKVLNVDRKGFEKDVLGKYGKTLFEWKEDVIRPRLLLTRMCQGRVKYTEEEVRKGFEAYYGEKVECRCILWPPDQAKFALSEYAKIRDSAEEFDKAARTQASSALASVGGQLPPIGRHTMGDKNLEEEAFKLQPGEVSTLIGTAQGQVVLKCVRRLPADATKKLEAERGQLVKEIEQKKVQQEMQVVFKQMRDKAQPRLLLQGTSKPADLAAESKALLSAAGAPGKPPGR